MSPLGKERASSVLHPFGKASVTLYSTVPGTQNPQGQGVEKKILIPLVFYFLSLLRGIFFLNLHLSSLFEM